jgi:23S rRNA (uracil1939-C5)-methyltransferase
MRHSTTTGGVTLTLLTDDGELPERERMVERLRASCPELQGMLWGINRGLADVARIDEERWRWGDLALVERINGLTFVIGPTAFFQTNTAAAEKLYQVVVEMAELGPEDRLLDAYCGAGAIALHCARRVERAVGIELSREAVWNARENAEANAIGNAVFLAAPVNEGLPLALQAAGGAFTRVVIDPPRGGMDKKSLAALIDLRAPVFVYVSCNPSTLARDLQTLAQSGYRVEALQAVDMFPHSHHIEAVARLRLSP